MRKIFIIIIFNLLLIFNIGFAYANIGDIGHWQDSVGGQIPGTTFGGFNFDNQIRNDGIYTKPNDSTIEVTEPGDYLIIATTHDEDTSNGRYNSQLRISQIAGTGDIFSSNYTGFSRNNADNESWTRGVGIIIGATANSQFQVQKRSDTDTPTGGSVVNSSDLQIVKIDKSNYGIYDIGGTSNIYGGTSPNTVDITNISNESDIASIEGNTTNNTITVKGDNKTYLVAWSVSFDSANSRTQRIGNLNYNNVDSLSTRSYCYGRNASNEYCGLGSMDIIRTNTTDIDIKTEIYRGDGVGADQGGADVDGTLATDGNGQMIVLEMPDYLEVFSSDDSVGLQDITTAQNLNIAHDVKIDDTGSFTKNNDTTINITKASDIFSWANIWTARSDVSSNKRQTSYGSIILNGVEQTTGMHGNYSRGNQGSQDTFAMGYQPAGIYTTTSAGETLGINSTPLAGGQAGGTDRTQAGTLGFFAINLDTFTPPPTEPILGVTFIDNDTDNTVNTNQVVKYNIDIQNTGADATGVSAVSQIDNNFGTPYGFSYVNCGNPSESFNAPNLIFSNISILGGNTCSIEYYVQVDSGATDGSTITSNIDVSNATEGGNDPAIINGDNLTVQACGLVNDVNLIFHTDGYGEDTYWSLTPNGNSCGVGEIANGGNTTDLDCNSGGAQSANAANGYADNSTISEGAYSLDVGTQYDLHVIDDWGDGMTGDPDVEIQQNGSVSDTFAVENNGGVFTFTVQNDPACSDTIKPDVTINQANSQSDPTTFNNITYSVIFDEPINQSTFDSLDISITGTTGTITSGPTEVSPFNGTSFEFGVSGMTQGDIVTATIPAGGIKDLSANTNNLSTSNDNQVTYNGVPPTPGGVSSGLQIWLKADAGTSTNTSGNSLNTWADQSSNGFDATAGIAPTYFNDTTNNLNFNPIVDFNGNDQYMENVNNGAYSQNYFMVVVPDSQIDGTITGQVPFGIDAQAGTASGDGFGLAFGGAVLGAFTSAINDEVITHALGSSSDWRSAQIGAYSYEANKPLLIGVNENSGANGDDIYEKGLKIDNYTANTYQTISATNYRLGMSTDSNYPFEYDGKIAEIINYNSRVSDTDRQKIEGYLSLKYGITLNSGTQDYIASDGATKFWSTSVAGSYSNDIFGIARDDKSGLGQIKSKSINSDGVLTIEAVGEGSNLSPSFTDISDLESLTISNNDLGNTWAQVGAPSGYYILDRGWMTQENGSVGTVNLDFDVDNLNFDIPDLSLGTKYYFIYDSNNDGDLSDETPIAMTNTTGSIWQIAGVNLSNGIKFTIATEASTNNVPTDITLSNNSIVENSAVGTTVGDFTTTDADSGDTHSYSLVAGSGDGDNSLFSISGNSLLINSLPDYEINNSYSVRVQTDDGNGGQFQKIFTIDITNVSETPNSIIDFENIEDENKYSVTSGTWTRTTTNPQEGSLSIESGNNGQANTQSCFEVFNTFTSTGTVEFQYNVSSESGGDFLKFYIDNTEQNSWSGTVPWTLYSDNTLASGTHSYKWCYIKNGSTDSGSDKAWIDYITFDDNPLDNTSPIVSSSNISSDDILPGGNHSIEFNYSDESGGSGINTSSASLVLEKWNGSSWINNTNISQTSISITKAIYDTSNLTFGKYRTTFNISDAAGNISSDFVTIFYIDEPSMNISTGSTDIGTLNSSTNSFAPDITITVKTIGAPFRVILKKNSQLTSGGGDTINYYDGTNGSGYDKNNDGNLSDYNDDIVGQEVKNINTNGDLNTYTYTVKMGAIIDSLQSAGNYSGLINFGLDLDY